MAKHGPGSSEPHPRADQGVNAYEEARRQSLISRPDRWRIAISRGEAIRRFPMRRAFTVALVAMSLLVLAVPAHADDQTVIELYAKGTGLDADFQSDPDRRTQSLLEFGGRSLPVSIPEPRIPGAPVHEHRERGATHTPGNRHGSRPLRLCGLVPTAPARDQVALLRPLAPRPRPRARRPAYRRSTRFPISIALPTCFSYVQGARNGPRTSPSC
jgi:hypothetical protein